MELQWYANSVEKRDELEPSAGQARRLYRLGSSAHVSRSLSAPSLIVPLLR